MVDVQTISVIIAAASVVVGVITFIMNSQKEARQRQMEFLFQRIQRSFVELEAWTDVIFMQDWKTYDDVFGNYISSKNLKALSEWIYIATFYNILGILLKEKVVDPAFFFSSHTPGAIVRTWEKYEPVVKEMRDRASEPTLFKSFEYLAEEVKRR